MNQSNVSHTSYNTPPPKLLPAVIVKEKETYSLWVNAHKQFPRVERLGIGHKIEQTFLSVLEYTFIAAYQPPEQKILVLCRTISKLDVLKFFLQLAWENKLIPTEQYLRISGMIEEIGRMLGGWKKGLKTKLPPERREKR